MPKRKRKTGASRPNDAKQDVLARKRARLRAKAEPDIKAALAAQLPPSPDTHLSPSPDTHIPDDPDEDTFQSQSIRAEEITFSNKLVAQFSNPPQKKDYIAYWASHNIWPQEFFTRRGRSMESSASSKRKSTSTHSSGALKRMQRHKIYRHDDRMMCKDSRTLCTTLIEGDRKIPGLPMYPKSQRRAIIRIMAEESEAMIQQFMMPTIIPPVLVLKSYGRTQLDDSFGDEINALWTRVETMGSTQPKPDYIAGLREEAFDDSTLEKLYNYATLATPAFVTPKTCFPILIGELKSAEVSTQIAGKQALHAAAIALKAQFSLYWAAYGKDSEIVKKLYGQALVFSICHDNESVAVFAHYAWPKLVEDLENPKADTTASKRTESEKTAKSSEIGSREADHQKTAKFPEMRFKKARPEETAKFPQAAAKRANLQKTASPDKIAKSLEAGSKETSSDKTVPSSDTSSRVAKPNRASPPIELEFYRSTLALWSLTSDEGYDRDQSYSFVEMLHEIFSPKHLERIRNAARRLPKPRQRIPRSVASGQLSINSETIPSRTSLEVAQAHEIADLKAQMAAQTAEQDAKMAAQDAKMAAQDAKITKLMQAIQG